MNIKDFKKKHRTFIAVGTVLLIVAATALFWKNLKKICETLKEDRKGNFALSKFIPSLNVCSQSDF
ncbi:MAG: hypothetical protein LUG93_01620 [Lachnospiraceae bacterium]|nr:hypothetical protein [Lachnospiraceae bacterium]